MGYSHDRYALNRTTRHIRHARVAARLDGFAQTASEDGPGHPLATISTSPTAADSPVRLLTSSRRADDSGCAPDGQRAIQRNSPISLVSSRYLEDDGVQTASRTVPIMGHPHRRFPALA
jgi:hypothetical protein